MLVSDYKIVSPNTAKTGVYLNALTDSINKLLEDPDKYPVVIPVQFRKAPLELGCLLSFLKQAYASKGWHVTWNSSSEGVIPVEFAPSVEHLIKELGYVS